MDTQYKGYIALDIDGTVTAVKHEIPKRVREYLRSLYEDGWLILFITGRTFSYGVTPLLSLDFPFYLAVQNGADILKMPEREVVFRSYVPKEVLPGLEEVYKNAVEDFVVYTGYEEGDSCYYRKGRFSPPLKDHIEEIKLLSSKPWIEVENFEKVSQSSFPLIKCFGDDATMEEIRIRFAVASGYSFSVIRNPFSVGGEMGLLTSAEASKGHAIDWIISSFGYKLPVIVAGDDRNDLPMLQKADVAIVMENAPSDVLAIADIIAPAAEKEGIIDGIKQALEKF